ncbi:PTPA-domain-containing protein [Cucurbitaria berberidis CBS 394.84]|uniref:Serine/threonine-protein phosphatase 2A activator n=1 Tax=Cucurbitaria berberidis CBS 394.84 TaxID=1168544 RepID=A0A9P4GPJ6_9PLEO|nr:PTPA-domain-containing protein [Cucurbitaria berberidis CBS 394.84]KAF1850308.1 PTPA-domain-containing protein [Cucurbitaria berberidis CBS 394.84]
MASQTSTAPALQILDPNDGHSFAVPAKRIHDGDDVAFFLASKAYADIMTFIFQLNTAMLPRRIKLEEDTKESAQGWRLNDPHVPLPHITQNLAKLLETLTAIIDEAPPDPGPRRFGNASFRVWYDLVRERVSGLLDQYLPKYVLAFESTSDISVKEELEAYLVGSFGSSQRLDYGTGHELSFLAFLGCLWKLGAFPESIDGDQERGIVLGVIEPYLVLIRRLILTYTLEPAGSHGVWGLDDHSFLPYIFGSAQFSPAITNPGDVAAEGSIPNAPSPADITKGNAVERERKTNMYFSAIGFIYDVKKGPFWEHSPILFDISGVKAGWAKINKGMIKMYNVEVLSKFPVVQHFPFGSLFAWEKDPKAKLIQASVHTASQPKSSTPSSTAPTARPQPPTAKSQPALRDPLADTTARGAQGGMPVSTAAPWAKTGRAAAQVPSGANQSMRAPWAAASSSPAVPSGPNQPTKAPWMSSTPAPPPPGGGTRAPWAKGSGGGNPAAAAETEPVIKRE